MMESCRGRKYCALPVLVLDVVALEDDPAPELPARVTGWEVGVLLDDEAKNHAKMDLLTGLSGFSSNIRPLSRMCLIPRASGP